MKTKLLHRYLKLKTAAEKEEHESETYEEIRQGINFGGFNLWILGAAMVIACIGLTTDSISAVIGAMLISPLMGPIVGFAFGLSINDLYLKKKGIRNWLMMTVISLIASTSFFLISPFDHSTAVLNSFTKATIFDILLAFFGGIAGFIGIIKKDGTKVLAGVAVATTCMPALCSAGFGLASGDIEFFLGGLYYYIINCLFIGWATFLLSRIFKYHFHFNAQSGIKMAHKWLWGSIIVLMLIPGIYLVYKKYKEEYKHTIITDKERIQQLEKKVQYLDSLMKQK